jgi:hypothetical protein
MFLLITENTKHNYLVSLASANSDKLGIFNINSPIECIVHIRELALKKFNNEYLHKGQEPFTIDDTVFRV